MIKNMEHIQKYKKIIGIIAGIIFLGALAWGFALGPSPSNDGFSLSRESLPSSWEFTGLYNTPELTANVQKNIETLKEKINEEGVDVYDIYLSIAQQYALVGKGKEAYDYLLKAVKQDPGNSLTFQTMGNLMESLKAYTVAEEAYKQATIVQPQILQNHLALIGFYLGQEAPAVKIESAFAFALEKSGRATNVLKEYAQWLEGQKDTAKAITIWEEVLKQVPEDRAVKDKINQLKRKLK